MEQLAWTLMALLAASTFGNMYYLGSKIDQKFDHLTSRLDHVIGELGDIKGELAAHRQDPHAHS